MAAQDILTAEDLKDIEAALVSGQAAAEIIEMAKRADIDVSELETRNKDTQERLRKIKRVFFPPTS